MDSTKVSDEKLNEAVVKRAMKISSLLILEILQIRIEVSELLQKQRFLLTCREKTNESWSELIASFFPTSSVPLK